MGTTPSLDGIRRASIQSANIQELSPCSAPHLRALHVFNTGIKIDLLKPILASSKILSTLDLQGAHVKVLPDEIFNLFNLRFLGLRYTEVESLPEEIGRLGNLQVLDASQTQLSSLPKGVVKLTKLRYIYATIHSSIINDKPFSGVKMPSGIGRLKGLRSLQCVRASLDVLREVESLTELRTFGVSDVKSEESANLSTAINKMGRLVHLEITALDENEVLQLAELRLPLTLSMLGLEGQLEKTSMPQVLSSWSHLQNLTSLRLGFSKIDQHSFSSLQVLHGLSYLEIGRAYEGKKLHLHASSFPKLICFFTWDALHLNQVVIEEGAMQSLAELKFANCPELMILPEGIEFLTALPLLYLEDSAIEFMEKFRRRGEQGEHIKEDLMKIRHIRVINIVQTS